AVVGQAEKGDVIKAQDEAIKELREMLEKYQHLSLVVQEHEKFMKKQAEEIERLRKLIKDPDVRKLEAENKQLRLQAEQFEAQLRTSQERTEKLVEHIQELTRALARKEAGVDPDRVVVRPNEPNPPAKAMEGKITKVDGN